MRDRQLVDMKILIVDDQPANVVLVRSILERAGYSNLHGESDPRIVQDWVQEHEPDLIILDLHMPQRDGFQVMNDLRQILSTDEYLPILVITADITQEVKRRALRGGATDFLTKPFDHIEVRLRVGNLLQTRDMHRRLFNYSLHLEDLVRERTAQLEAAHIGILERLALAAEFRDDATGQHTKRVGRLSMLVARELAMPDDFVGLIERAAPLHDVGKIGIPDAILLKPDRLDEHEWELMKTHTTIGAQLLASSNDPLLHLAEEIALGHHERWDGGGYPNGYSGETIPVQARIVAVTDVFDALTHQRPYKPAWTLEAAIAEIDSQRGRQFAPNVVDAFLEVTAKTGWGVCESRSQGGNRDQGLGGSLEFVGRSL
jgi:putative two-component system response regulator